MGLEFRPLRADEVELRVSTCNEKGFSVLLYKDARCDQNILDETVGAMNWQRHHSRDNANCEVTIWDDEKKQWVGKEDTGTESFTEKEKGLASDSFKRACFNWGIGRELYTAPFIWISGHVKKNDKGKYVPDKNYDRDLRISELETKDGVITKLVIKDKNGRVAFSEGNGVPKAENTEPIKSAPKESDNVELNRLKAKICELMEEKNVPMKDILAISKFDSFDKFDIPECNGCIKWLSQKGS